MNVSRSNLEGLQAAMQSVTEAWENIEQDVETWLDAQEDRAAYDRETISDARDTIESGLGELDAAIRDAASMFRARAGSPA